MSLSLKVVCIAPDAFVFRTLRAPNSLPKISFPIAAIALLD